MSELGHFRGISVENNGISARNSDTDSTFFENNGIRSNSLTFSSKAKILTRVRNKDILIEGGDILMENSNLGENMVLVGVS